MERMRSIVERGIDVRCREATTDIERSHCQGRRDVSKLTSRPPRVPCPIQDLVSVFEWDGGAVIILKRTSGHEADMVALKSMEKVVMDSCHGTLVSETIAYLRTF
jgi:hypothetical protein